MGAVLTHLKLILLLGIPEGPPVGLWRDKAYDLQLEGGFSDRTSLLRWLAREVAAAREALGAGAPETDNPPVL